MAMLQAEVGSLYDGPPVLVRNTFLEFEEQPELRRVKTAPAKPTRPDEDEEEEEEDPEDPEDPEEPAEEFDHTDQPALTMSRTEDLRQELGNDWEWAGGATGHAFRAAPGVPWQDPPGEPQTRTSVSLEAMTALPTGPPMGAVPQMAPVGQFQNFMFIPVMVPMSQPAPAMNAQDMGPASPPPPPVNRPVMSIETADEAAAPPPPMYSPAATGATPASGSAPPPLERTVATATPADQLAAPPKADLAPPPLWREQSARSGYDRVHWNVDARKLKSKDTQAVSPPFELTVGSRSQQLVAFKLMIRPELTAEGRGGSSFKKAKGRGRVILKCESETELDSEDSLVCFRIAVGAGKKQLAARGPVCHNFSTHASCGLTEAEEIWDFSEVVTEENTSTFVVCLQIVPVMEAPA